MQWHPDAKIGPVSHINGADTKHVEQQGQKCPRCGSEEIEGDEVTIDSGHAVQDMSCGACDSTWTDVYALLGFAGLRAGVTEEEEEEEDESEADAD